MSVDELDTENPYAMRARVERATKLVTEVRRLNLPLAEVLDMPAPWWADLAAGIDLPGSPPSDITIAMALGMLTAPGLAGLTMPKTRPTCDLCNERITVDQPTARHMGATVHADCQHDYEEGWDRE